MIEKEYVEVTTTQAYALLAELHEGYKNDSDVHPVIDYLMDIILGSMMHQHMSPDEPIIKANVNVTEMKENAKRSYNRVKPDDKPIAGSIDIDLTNMTSEERKQTLARLLAGITGGKEDLS